MQCKEHERRKKQTCHACAKKKEPPALGGSAKVG
jgi:hypothetical protein